MIFVDTHSHLYLEQFDHDRPEVIARAIDAGVKYMLLPNIDSTSLPKLLQVAQLFPENCFPMIALHPTDVKENSKQELELLSSALTKNRFYAIGETGIDLYWDKTFFKQQCESLALHCEWSLEMNLPIVIHSRESHKEIMDVLTNYRGKGLTGVFHCFSGDYQQAKEVLDFGFFVGIGGTITYKKSQLPEVVSKIGLPYVLLETDAPFLSPIPNRGKRNESSNIPLVAKSISNILNIPLETVAFLTTENAVDLFKITTEKTKNDAKI